MPRPEPSSSRKDEASRVLQVAMLKYMLKKALKEKTELENLNLQHKRKSALRTVVVALLKSALRNLQQEKVASPSIDIQVHRERAVRRVLIALLRYQLARAKSRNDLLRSIPENLRDQDRWKVLLEREEARREALLVDKLNVMNELRTLQDERRALERMLDEERKKLVKSKEIQNRLKSDLETTQADKLQLSTSLELSQNRVVDLESEVGSLQASLLAVHSDTGSWQAAQVKNEAGGSNSQTPCARITKTAELRRRLREMEDALALSQRENEQLRQERDQRESSGTSDDDENQALAVVPRTQSASLIEHTLVMTVQTVFTLWYYFFPYPRIF